SPTRPTPAVTRPTKSTGTPRRPRRRGLTSRFRKRSTARPSTGWSTSAMPSTRSTRVPIPEESSMRGAVLHGPGDVRVETLDDPTIVEPTDAIVRLSAACICGSDLWPYRGANPIKRPTHMGHEYCGIVEEVGSAVTSVKKGQFVIGSFFASDNTCPHCHHGYQTSCT